MKKGILKNCPHCGIEHDRTTKECYNIECKRKERECRRLLKNPNDILFCKYCGDEIKFQFKKPTSCSKLECKHLAYADTFYKKQCECCHTEFDALQKQIYCDDCRKDMFNKHRYESLKIINQEVRCPQCNKLTGNIDKFFINNITKNDSIGAVCEDCKKKNLEKQSQRMKEFNPMRLKETVDKVYFTKYGKERSLEKYIPKYKQLGFLNFSEYMKVYNPMKNEETKIKVKNTLKNKILTGEFIYKTGKHNPNYKGKRSLGKHIRDHLYEWRQNILKENNYTCQNCGISGVIFHVHHILPLSNIIQNVCDGYDTKLKDVEIGSELYFNIANDVVQYHYDNAGIGTLLCRNCHDILDKFYHKPKNITNENSKN